MILGITGGSGSGKTTLLAAVSGKGGTVIDCDAVYHQLLTRDTSLLSAIENRFGCVENGCLDRKKLGSIVFSDPAALQDLNAITHAAVKKEVLSRLQTAADPVAIDAIALFESGLSQLCDTTVAVTAPKEVRVRRLMERDGISETYARSRIDAQPEDSYFTRLCVHTLVNDGTKEEFTAKCLAFLAALGIM